MTIATWGDHPPRDFSNIAVNIKTFLRDEFMFDAVKGIVTNMPGAQIIIADDGRMTPAKSGFYGVLELEGHIVKYLSFDSGFGVKNNVIAQVCNRPFLLIGCDDWQFTAEAAKGIQKLEDVLLNYDIDVASGRLGRLQYEFLFDETEPGIIREIPIDADINGRGQEYIECDLTVNYCLVKQRVLKRVRWDEDAKIGGGDHGAWFLDVKHAGFKVAYVPGVTIENQKDKHPSAEYRKYRNRAHDPKRPCFDRRGIREYYLGDGRCDYRRQ